MPRTLAVERKKLTVLTSKPADVLNPTLTELAAGKDLQTKTLRGETRLSAATSETFSEPLDSDRGNPSDFGASNFEGSITVFRFLDPDTGLPVALEDDAWETLKEKGTELWAYQRTGPKHSQSWATTDKDVEYFHFLTDEPQHPSSLDGYIKRVIPLAMQGDCSITGVTIKPGSGGS